MKLPGISTFHYDSAACRARAGLRLAVAATLFIATLLLSACTAENRVPGYVYFRIGGDPTTLDPALIVDVAGGSIAAKMFNGLLRLDDQMRVVPDLARSWEVSPDGKTYHFKLREGVTFSSGREVVATDVKYSFERVLEPATKSPKTWLFDKVRGAREFMEGHEPEVTGFRVLGRYEFAIELTEPFSPFPGLLTMPAAYVVPFEEVFHWGPEFSAHPVGTGPFVLESWKPNREVVLMRNEGYFGGRPWVEGIVYRVIPEELTAVAEFELGNLDVLAIPSSEFGRYRDDEKWAGLVEEMEGLNTYYLGLNMRSPVFSNSVAREAASRAIDRVRILATLYEGRGRLASGPVPDGLRAWEAPPLREMFPYDPASARAALERSGLAGKAVRFYVPAEQQVVDIAEVIQSYLAAAGFRVEIRQLEWSAFKDAIAKGEADLFWLSWWADYPDPENFLFPLFHSENQGPGGNRVMYSNPLVDALIEKGRSARDAAERDALYGEAERIVVADAPWVFFWHRSDYMVRQPWLAPLRSSPVYTMDKGLDLAFSPK